MEGCPRPLAPPRGAVHGAVLPRAASFRAAPVADLPPEEVLLRALDDFLKRCCAPLFEDLDVDISDQAWTITAALRQGEGIVRDVQVREERREPRCHRALANAEGNRRTLIDVHEPVAEAVARR